jgi:acetyl esterase/lipase
MPYGREELTAVAEDLSARGYAVWNIEYRRMGAPGGGWPGTLDDVAAAVDHLETITTQGIELDLNRVILVGHSAGGQLALWAAARNRSLCFDSSVRVRPIAAVGLAPIVDLARTWTLGAGQGAVEEFIGGSPDRHSERYAAASPIELLPLGARQLVIHGVKDEVLPVGFSREYAVAAQASGDDITYIELADAGHMDFIDPNSKAHAAVCEWLTHASAGSVTHG